METTEDNNIIDENNNLPIEGQIGYEELLYNNRKEEEKNSNMILDNQMTFDNLIFDNKKYNNSSLLNVNNKKDGKKGNFFETNNKIKSDKNLPNKIESKFLNGDNKLDILNNEEKNKLNNQIDNNAKNNNQETQIDNYCKNINENTSLSEKNFDLNIKNLDKTLEKKNEEKSNRLDNKNYNNGNNGNDNNGIITKSLDEVIHDSMIPYTEHVVMDRALPRVEDGLKPVQRRILYSMMELGLTPDKQYRKSARIVGDCMGKYHPHGDSSVYDAMVRMAQDYSLREPLVDGHGNFGSIDGDSAAAMRYTEAKLTPLALELLRDLEKNTVHWSLNFDDTTKEPDMLPGRFPNLLVNGASGIAVGVATNIPPHNLSEVIDGVCAYIKNPHISTKGLMQYIKAPDFPTGGLIIANNELEKAYETGKGKIINRAKVAIEKNDDKYSIVITEVPYQVNKSAMLQRIANLKEDNKGILSYIGEIIDESDRNGLRAVIKIKKDGNPKAILRELLKSTPLEVSYNINMVAIAGGKPKLLSLKEVIAYYVDYQQEIIIRRSKFDLNNALSRSHIVEGLLKAIDQIDKIIKIIRRSKTVNEAKIQIIEQIGLTDLQAQAILDMRLARLVNLEIVKLQEEYDSLVKLIQSLRDLLSSKSLQYQTIIKELEDIKKRFGNKRRSSIVIDNKQDEDNIVENIVEESDSPCLLTISADDKIKNIPIKNRAIDTAVLNNINNLFDIQVNAISVQNNDNVLIFTNKGNCLKIKAKEIPESKWKKKGVSLQNLNNLIAYDEKPIKIISIQPYYKCENMNDINLITYSKHGLIKRTSIQEYLINRPYFQAMSIKENDEIINVELQNNNSQDIILITKETYSLKININDFPIQKRTTAGIRSMKMLDNDYIIFAGQTEKRGGVTLVSSSGNVKKVPISEYQTSPRYRRGLKTINLKSNEELVYARYDAEPNNICVKKGNNFDFISTNKIPYDNRLSKGKNIIKGKFDLIYTCLDRCKI